METPHQLGVRLHMEMPIDLLHVTGNGVDGNLEMVGDFLAALAVEQEIQRHALAGREPRHVRAPVLGPALFVEPADFAQDDMGDARLARGEWRQADAAKTPMQL